MSIRVDRRSRGAHHRGDQRHAGFMQVQIAVDIGDHELRDRRSGEALDELARSECGTEIVEPVRPRIEPGVERPADPAWSPALEEPQSV